MSRIQYLALAGPDAAIRRLLASHVPGNRRPLRLNRRFDRPGLVIFASPETPVVPIGPDGGLLLGRLFDRHGDAVARLGEVADAALQSGGRSLIRDCWGNYLAFLRGDRETIIVRDPSAAIPAYVHDERDIRFICSDLELARELVAPAGVDEQFLRQWLSFPYLRCARTGFEGWLELLPGTAAGQASGTRLVWNPWHWSKPERDKRLFDDAARTILTIALSTVPRLVSDLGRPVLELSGGLDSSIVAACLHQAGIGFDAVTFATRLPDGDERHYARLVAGHVGASLSELAEDELPLDLTTSRQPHFRPPLSPVLQPLERARRAYAETRPGTTFITGAGGDNIFCYLGTAAPILDALREGPQAALRTARDVAAVGDCTIFKAFGFALRKAAYRPFRRRWPQDRRFLVREAIAARPDRHPWLDAPPRSESGKVEHVEALIRAQHFQEAHYAHGDPVRHPLLSQPLMEACLAVPTPQWVKGGRNRSMARRAFAGLLPAEIINRRTKGRLESMCARAFRDNRSQLAALLLDGELCRRGLVDRNALEAYLSAEGEPPNDDYFRVFDLASLELWLSSTRR